jgi:hypothetical protein
LGDGVDAIGASHGRTVGVKVAPVASSVRLDRGELAEAASVQRKWLREPARKDRFGAHDERGQHISTRVEQVGGRSTYFVRSETPSFLDMEQVFTLNVAL